MPLLLLLLGGITLAAVARKGGSREPMFPRPGERWKITMAFDPPLSEVELSNFRAALRRAQETAGNQVVAMTSGPSDTPRPGAMLVAIVQYGQNPTPISTGNILIAGQKVVLTAEGPL